MSSQKSKRFRCCAFVSFTIGVILFAVSVLVPPQINKLLNKKIKEQAHLSEDTASKWAAIPGELDLFVSFNYYLYNCTNAEKVILEGARPEFNEVGPFVYRYFQEFTQRNYTKLQLPWHTQQMEKEAVVAFKKTWNEKWDVSDDTFEQQLVFVNPAAFMIWSQAQRLPELNLVLNLLYQTIIFGMG